MKRLSLLIITIFLFSCQTLPIINSPSSLNGDKSFTCPYPFSKEKVRLVHTMEVRMPGDIRSAIIGVTLVDPSTRSVSCAIMTAEGMVLFEAESSQGELKVNRALPPFNSDDLAKNMIEDIKLIFFEPDGKIKSRGYLPDGATICRYLQKNGDSIDIIGQKSAGVQIKRYSSSGTLKRHILFNEAAKNIYQRIELRAYETFDYSLVMDLIEAKPLKKGKKKIIKH
jgi:hypothetical protein